MNGTRKPRATSHRRSGAILTLAAVTVILVVTLTPGGHEVPSGTPWCLICGTMGTADAVLNTFLFMPLGFGLGLLHPSLLAGTLGGAIVSGFVETAQVFIPGRDGSPGDVFTNVAGATAGAWIARYWRAALRPRIDQARQLRHAWAAGAVVSFTTAALLLAPALPRSDWYVQWTARLGHFDHYEGRILNTSLDHAPLPPGRHAESPSVHERLRRGAPLTVVFLAGPAPGALAPIVSIYDGAQREVLVLGTRGQDLVIRYRTRAIALRLDVSEFVAPGALAGVRPGDTVTITLRWRHPAIRLMVDDIGHETGPALHAAPGLLVSSQPVLGTWPASATTLWLGFVFVPLGFWTSGRRSDLVPAVVCLLGLLLVPLAIPLRPTPALWLSVAAAATTAGLLLRRTMPQD